MSIIRLESVGAASAHAELPISSLRARFGAELFPFKTTLDLAESREIIGQERAVRAMDFGLHVPGHGYNIYVSGVPGTGKNAIIKPMLRQIAESQPTPEDWCYVYNFRDPDRPHALNLPAGRGCEFRRDIETLVNVLKDAFRKAFQSKDYEEQHQALQEDFSKTHAALSADLEKHARQLDFLIKTTPMGFVTVPVRKGKPIAPEEFADLDPEVKADIQRREKDVDEAVRVFRQKLRALQEEINSKVEKLNQRVASYTSEHLFEGVREKYRDFANVLDYIRSMQDDVLKNFEGFLETAEAADASEDNTGRFVIRYAVNLVVDNEETRGAPILEDTNPTYANLVGRVERKARMGFLYTDFTLIKAGSILKSNGGYLLVNALDVLRSPFSWEALKRAVMRQEVVIEDPAEAYGIVATASIRPEPIPMRLRVIMVGSPFLYYLLQAYDEDFGRIFKVKADFDVIRDLTDESPMQYAHFVANLCHDEGLLPFDAGAVAGILEQAARAAEHQRKLSLRFSDLADLVRESSYWAGRGGASVTERTHVVQAIEEKIHRSDLLGQRIREVIAEGTLMVDVAGEVVGQVNGLSIHDLGDFSFGRPSRITARVFLGGKGVVNIEREAKLSGNVHSKGMLILAGFLGGRFARGNRLSLSATIAFEQSYGMVDGDSASVAELLVLLSALADVPLRQAIAVTGSVNQRGEVQAVGGVNEKIEGYFAVCKAMGLSGEQGVVIPQANVRHLMLKDEVVEAVAAGKFHVYAVSTVDEAIEVVTARTAGDVRWDGTYPVGTVNAAVLKRLREMDETQTLRDRRGGSDVDDLEE